MREEKLIFLLSFILILIPPPLSSINLATQLNPPHLHDEDRRNERKQWKKNLKLSFEYLIYAQRPEKFFIIINLKWFDDLWFIAKKIKLEFVWEWELMKKNDEWQEKPQGNNFENNFVVNKS